MKRREFSRWVSATAIASIGSASLAGKASQPNLLIIHTDEHNFRTIGCYRAVMSDEQSYVWGAGVKVDTPHIDSLAHDGALCTSYYAASPVCTPSRASLVSGLYPVATGSPSNDMPMKDDIVTFAEVFRRNGYATSYVGKWHLDGEAKPGFSPVRKFGFEDNRYMINRGHWKNLEDAPNGPAVGSREKGQPSYDVGNADNESYTTDFLTDRAISIIDRDKAKPFCLMLSIPDPHGPNTVRKPYDTMFEQLHFENPRTMDVDASAMPEWAKQKTLVKALKQDQMRAYFGMVKCIDDNVGKILKYLAALGLDKNTIVVFTSDHGDLMGEHKKHNKGLPYETSARIPFIIRYPEKIAAGKVIRTAYCNVDFSPTILSIAGITNEVPIYHGKDTSADFLSPEKEISKGRIIYISHAGSKWVAAVNNHCKLVLSPLDDPWLLDLRKDPDELINFYTNPEYGPIAERLRTELLDQIKLYNDPILKRLNLSD